MGALVAVAALVALPTNSTALSTAQGTRPGPAVLYEPLAQPPELSLRPPFRVEPLMVSGTDAYCDGEYLYQDYLFDDHGANTHGSYPQGDEWGIFPPAGDVRYPANDARYARNAADIVEFRMVPTKDATVFRITFNTVVSLDAPVVGIGIDTDRGAAVPVAWPNGAGLTSPGIDTFVTAWGRGGEITTRPATAATFGAGTLLPAGAVALDATANQLTISVPRSLLAPVGKWRLFAGAGLWDGAHGFLPVTADNGDGAPAVFNLAFRFDEKQGGDNDGNTVIGYGNYLDESQGKELAEGTSGTAFADVDFDQLRGKGCRSIHSPGRDQARIFASHLDVPEGVHSDGMNFGGHLQPYMLHLPPPSSKLPGLTLALHGNTATYTQWHVVSRNYLTQMGDERNHVIVSPLGRSTNGSGIEYDWFEAMADAVHRVAIDPTKATISGYSAGGYNTFVASTQFPDLFGSAFAIVGAGRLLNGGAQGDYTNFDPNLGNLRWVPVVAWNQAVDELAPYVGIRGTMTKLDQLGLRNELFTFAVGEHFTPGLLDQWKGGAAYAGDGTVPANPYRVDYTIAPETWAMLSPDFGPDTAYPRAHLTADHAYWVSNLRTRGPVRDETNTIRGSISAISHATGEVDPVPRRTVAAYAGPPQPAAVDGTAWDAGKPTAPSNALDLTLHNLASADIDGGRAGLRGDEPLKVSITSDGDAEVRITLPGRERVVLGAHAGTQNVSIAPETKVLADEKSRLPATGGTATPIAALLLALALAGRRGRQMLDG